MDRVQRCEWQWCVLRWLPCNGHPGQWGWVEERRSGCRGTWSLCSCFGQDSSCHQRMWCLGTTFLNGSIISNCVKLPFPKGLPMAARALMLIGQIVFGFETQTVINETTVNELGPRWFSPPCFSCWYRFNEVLPCIFGHCAWMGKPAAWPGWQFWTGCHLSVLSLLFPHFMVGEIESQKGREYYLRQPRGRVAEQGYNRGQGFYSENIFNHLFLLPLPFSRFFSLLSSVILIIRTAFISCAPKYVTDALYFSSIYLGWCRSYVLIIGRSWFGDIEIQTLESWKTGFVAHLYCLQTIWPWEVSSNLKLA